MSQIVYLPGWHLLSVDWSVYGWTLQHGSLRGIEHLLWLASQRVRILRILGNSHIGFSDLNLEVTQNHFFCTLFVETVIKSTCIDPISWCQECQQSLKPCFKQLQLALCSQIIFISFPDKIHSYPLRIPPSSPCSWFIQLQHKFRSDEIQNLIVQSSSRKKSFFRYSSLHSALWIHSSHSEDL